MLTLRRFNNWLSIFLIVGAVYLLVSPFLGDLTFWFHKNFEHHSGYVYQTHLLHNSNINKNLKPIPLDNRLVIPSMQLDQAIHEGTSVYTLNKGLWHMPGSSSPDKGGNTVILGHRFTYLGPAVLFNIDKVSRGDSFALYWQHKEYDYKVTDVSVVSPFDLSIVQPTNKPTVTIYTCTPLWTSKQRLVVQAELWRPKS